MRNLYLFKGDRPDDYFLAACDKQEEGNTFYNLAILYENGQIVNEESLMTSYTVKFSGDVIPIGSERKRIEEKLKTGYAQSDDIAGIFNDTWNSREYSTGYSYLDSNDDELSDPEIKLGQIYLISSLVANTLLQDVNSKLIQLANTRGNLNSSTLYDSLQDAIMGLQIVFSINTSIKTRGKEQVLIDITTEYVQKALGFWQQVQRGQKKMSNLAATRHMDDNVMITPLTLFMILAGYESINTTEELAEYGLQTRFPTRPIEDLLA